LERTSMSSRAQLLWKRKYYTLRGKAKKSIFFGF
jgi:hypothetical protein